MNQSTLCLHSLLEHKFLNPIVFFYMKSEFRAKVGATFLICFPSNKKTTTGQRDKSDELLMPINMSQAINLDGRDPASTQTLSILI